MLEQFKELMGYGSFRPYNGGYEVRVKDLDSAFNHAQEIVSKHNLQLKVYGRDVRLRSFFVAPDREEVAGG